METTKEVSIFSFKKIYLCYLSIKQMFTFKSSPAEENYSLDDNPPDDIKANNIPVYTMKQDLENSGKPEAQQQVFLEKEPESTQQAIFFTEKQKRSPFLSSENVQSQPKKATWSGSIPEKETASPSSAPPMPASPNYPYLKKETASKKEPLVIMEDEKPKPAWRKVILSALTLFIILIFGFGGYYFWINQQNIDIPNVSTNLPPVLTQEKLSYSTENPNYLSIDINTADAAKIKSSIDKYAQEIIGDKVATPVEFIISDQKNEPVLFSTFAQKIGISFSSQLTSLLDDTFSLFIYNDNGQTKLGLAIYLKPGEQVQHLVQTAALTKEEPDLADELKSLFLVSSYTIEKKPFSQSSYNGTEIRYLNILSPEDLSVDYAIFDNQLLIGTTRMTLRSEIDYLKNQTGIENVTSNP
jgi:hypothetical protein